MLAKISGTKGAGQVAKFLPRMMFALLFVSFLMERSIVKTLLKITPPLPPLEEGWHTLPANGRTRPPPAGCEQTN